MKITRTYLSGCTWCNASGFVNNPMQGAVTMATVPCPVCNGSKIVLITEVTEIDDNQNNPFSMLHQIHGL
jgi:hypothetical protein